MLGFVVGLEIVKVQRFGFLIVLSSLSVHCTPGLDGLSDHYGVGGGTAGSGGQGTSGETSGGGGDVAGSDGGGAAAGGDQGGSSPNAGAGAANEGGTGPAGGSGGGQGEAGSGDAGAGEGGSGPTKTCVDGCAIMYVPFVTGGSGQFFTINLDFMNGVDLSTAIVSARLRTLQGTSQLIQLYATALPDFNFHGTAKTSLASLANGGTLTMDLTNTGSSWDNTKVRSFGFLIDGTIAETVQILVEEVTITNSPTVGPWLFTKQADVNESSMVDPTFYTPNIFFANPYQQVPGAKGIWMKPSP